MTIRMATAGEKTMSALDLLDTIGNARLGTRLRAKQPLVGWGRTEQVEIPAGTIMDVSVAYRAGISVYFDRDGQLASASINANQFHLLEIVPKRTAEQFRLLEIVPKP